MVLLATAALLLWPARMSGHLVWAQCQPPAPRNDERFIDGSRSWSSLRPRRTTSDGADLLRVVEAVLPALEAGLTPSAALALAAEVTPGGERSATTVLVSRLAGLSAAGLPIGPFWAQAAAVEQSPELTLLAQAWSLTEELGAPLAEAVRTTAGLLRARIEAERRAAGAVAGARATMNVLTALPLGGPLVALALGVHPRELYAGSPVTALCLVAGGVLVLGGRWWVARMVQNVARGPVLR
jgi:tight adherence protein B